MPRHQSVPDSKDRGFESFVEVGKTTMMHSGTVDVIFKMPLISKFSPLRVHGLKKLENSHSQFADKDAKEHLSGRSPVGEKSENFNVLILRILIRMAFVSKPVKNDFDK